MSNEAKTWSEDLQQQTREAISEMRVNPDGKLHFKSHGKDRAYITVQDLMRGKLTLTDKESCHITDYADADELLAAGWAID